jgi:uncharacterized iron-regulated protein
MSRPTAPAAALLACLGVAAPATLRAQDPHAIQVRDGIEYRVYDRVGGSSSLSAIGEATARADVLLIGEEHDDLVGHRLELELLDAALDRYAPEGAEPARTVVLSLEMFEQDIQYIVDEYLLGLITEEHFIESSRAWSDYRVYYRPLVEAAKARGAPVVAANAPRRYVNRVTNDGPESLWALSAQARSYLPPLPFPGPSDAYRSQWDSVMSQSEDPGQAHAHSVSENELYAQALWDASMGYAIAGALTRTLGSLVIHVAGSFHVERGTGIPERIADYRPGTRVVSVVIAQASDVSGWMEADDRDLADFVILTRQ